MHDNNIGVYKIECIKNGRVYVGQSKNIKVRLRTHLFNLRNLNYTINQPELQADFNRYGESQFIFELIHECEEDFLLRWETYYIDYFTKAKQKVYNIVKDTANPSILQTSKANYKTLQRIDDLLNEGKINIDALNDMLDTIS